MFITGSSHMQVNDFHFEAQHLETFGRFQQKIKKTSDASFFARKTYLRGSLDNGDSGDI